MKKLLGIVVLGLGLVFSGNAFADLNYEPIGKTYVIEDQILTVSNNGVLDEVYICKPTAEKCKQIARHFSFMALAKECEGIEQKNIYFAVNKEHFFMGGINENAPLRIYDFEGNVYGSAPNLEYAKNHCEFYEESK